MALAGFFLVFIAGFMLFMPIVVFVIFLPQRSCAPAPCNLLYTAPLLM